MAVETTRNNICVNHIIGQKTENFMVEGDSIIPDIKPDIINAISQVKNMQGGIAISSNNEILDSLDLKIGGLMSDKSIDVVNEKLKNMLDTAYNKLGVNKEIEPFMTLAFLALPVIPEIKITDKGLFDVNKFEFIQI